MKSLFIFITIFILNSTYFEYVLSMDVLPEFLVLFLGFILLIINIYGVRILIKHLLDYISINNTLDLEEEKETIINN